VPFDRLLFDSMSSPEHAESESAALRRFNPLRYPWKRMRVWQAAIYLVGWLLTWVGGFALVLLGAVLGNRTITIFGAASLLLLGPVLLWLSDRFVAQLPPAEADTSREQAIPQHDRPGAIGNPRPRPRKSKPKPKQPN
jgi:hypothetical protein